MSAPTGVNDYFVDEADLEASVDLPVLGRMEWEPRFHQLQEGLQGMTADPSLSERLYQLIRTPAPIVWVTGLGDGGEELPVAVGLAERASAHGLAPLLLAGPEARRPRGVSVVGLRPVTAGPYATTLEALYPGGGGATASGIQGVWRLWPGFDGEAAPIEPAALIVTGRSSAEGLVPPPDQVSGVVLVVPYRDLPAQWIVEGVTRLQTMGYPLLGMVAVSARAVSRRVLAAGEEGADAMSLTEQGGAMEGASNEKARIDDELEAPEQQETASLVQDDPEDDEREGAEEIGRGRAQVEWDRTYGPAAPRPRAKGLPWWAWVAVLLALGAVAIVGSRMLGVESGTPPAVVRSAAESRAPAAAPVTMEDLRAEGAETTAPEAETTVLEAETTAPEAMAESQVPSAEEAAPAVVASEAAPIQSPPPAAQPSARPAATLRAAPFGVMVGSFQQPQRAQTESARLAALGLDARVVQVDLSGKGTWYRVVVGSWTDAAQARAKGAQVVGAGWVKQAMLVSGDGYGPPIPGELK